MSAVAALPHGFAVTLDSRVRRLDGGTALLGGSPTRLLRLKPAATVLLATPTLRVRDGLTAALARRLLDAGVAHPRPSRGPGPAEVTIVIPVRDNAPGVQRLLDALEPVGPVVVVDDGSRDPEPLHALAREHGARLLRHPVSRGPAAARNTGLTAVRTPFVSFLDSDVVPRPGWLPTLLAHLSDPAVALAAPRIVALPGARGWIARYETACSSLDLGPREAAVVPRSRVAYVPSAAMVLRVAAVSDRCFDESMAVAEDVELCWWLAEQGWRMRYEPAAQVAHQHRSDLRKWLARKAFYGTGAAPLAARHPGQVPPVLMAPWMVTGCALASTGTPLGLLGAAALGAASTLRLARRLSGLRHPYRTAAGLSVHGLVVGLAQLPSAACRSYWPVAVLAALVLPRTRRALLGGAVVEGVLDWARHRDGGGLDPLRHLLAKRLDDLAYGAGLWWGAIRGRSSAALRPAFSR